MHSLSTSRTALHEAAAANRLDECARLMKQGIPAEVRDRLGITPLDEAEARNHCEVAALLAQHFRGERKTWTALELSCPVCFGLLWMPVEAGDCGHVFCRSCLQLSRRATSNKCPVCRAPVTLPSAFLPNAALMHLTRTHLPTEWTRTEAEQRTNPVEIAIANLLNLGVALGLGDKLAFNAAGSCCLLIDGEFLMHVTLLSARRLFVYSPLLDGLPCTQLARLALCERILLGALENDEDVPGGVGILQEQQLIIYHREIDLIAAQNDALRAICPTFVAAIKRWRQRLQEVLHTVEGVAFAPASPASKRRACRMVLTQRAASAADLSQVARLAVAKSTIDQFLADARAMPLAYERGEGGIVVRLVGLSIRYLPACDRILLSSPLLEDDSVISDEGIRLRVYEELLSASAFGSHTPAGGAALESRDANEPRLTLYAAVTCDKLHRGFIADFGGAVATWRMRVRALSMPPPRQTAGSRARIGKADHRLHTGEVAAIK